MSKSGLAAIFKHPNIAILAPISSKRPFGLLAQKAKTTCPFWEHLASDSLYLCHIKVWIWFKKHLDSAETYCAGFFIIDCTIKLANYELTL